MENNLGQIEKHCGTRRYFEKSGTKGKDKKKKKRKCFKRW